MRLSSSIRIILYSAILCWGAQCDHDRPATQYQTESGAVLIAVVVPDSPMGMAAAKAAIVQGRLRVSGTGMAPRDTSLTVQGGRLQAQVDGIPVGLRTVALFLLESSGDTLWQAADEVTVRANETATATLVLERVGDLPPQTAFAIGPELGGIHTVFRLQAQVADLHDPTDSLQVRWDFDNDGKFEVDWTVAKDTSCVFGAAGNYRIVLEARDRGGKTGSITKQVQVVELVAQTGRNLGADTLQVTPSGELITLDGSASRGIEGQELIYHWDQVLDYPGAKDVSVLGTLTDNHSARASRVSFESKVGRGLYVFTLRVEAGGIQSDPDTLYILVHSARPTVSVVAPGVVEAGQSLILQGQATDTDDTVLQYRWRGERVDLLSDTTSATPTFRADQQGEYQYRFVAIDEDPQESVPVEVKIPVSKANTPPVAVAGKDLRGVVSMGVSLDGRESSDADGEVLSYAWTQTEGPAIALANSETATPSFVPGEAGIYRFSLTVSDAKSSSTPDEVVVIVIQQAGEAVGAANVNAVQTVISTVLARSLAKGPGIHPGAYSGQVKITLVSAKPVQAGVSRRYSLEFEDYSEDGGVFLDGAIRYEVAGADTTYTGDLSLFGQYSGEVKVAVSISKGVTAGSFTVGDAVYPVAQVPNQAPVAQAGADQTVEVGSVVQLDGSESSDPDAGDVLTYQWTTPAGISLSSTTVAQPTFTASVAGIYRFSLVVNDGKVDSTPDTVVITVVRLNRAPVAKAGVDQTVEVGATVQLDGRGSSDADGDALSYRWSGPVGVALSSTVGAQPTFIVSAVGTYRFSLMVNDGQVDSVPDEVVITVVQPNRAPVAKAGLDQAVSLGATVQLDGSGSRDVDGDTLIYRWTAPTGINLSSATVTRPTFTASAAGTYRFVLVVNDGQADSVPDTVVVTVQEVSPPGKTLTVNLPGGATMDFVWIEPGTFTMGSSSSEPERQDNEGPQHQVTISQGFYLGKYEITQGQWQTVMGAQPWSGQDYVQANPSNPAVYISWDDMQAFIRKLNDTAGENIYRLPTEAEWEYACRAGTTTRWSFGDDESQLKDYAWYYDNAWNVGEQYAHAVGIKLPNPWGLYDMHGNVFEWVQDWYGSYTSSVQIDPTGPTSGSYRVVRGGFFRYIAQSTRSAYRGYLTPVYGYNLLGARLVRRGDVVRVNQPPTVDAGPDQTVNAGATVQLDGSGSRDVDGDTLIYRWTAPTGINLSSATVTRPTFTASAAGTYRFVLVVNDGQADSVPDTVVVTVVQPNRAPVANAGPDQSVNVGTTVQLDGSGSRDADGDSLTYRWISPVGISLTSATIVRPTFTASVAGTYRFTLEVNDGKVDSVPDTVVVTVNPKLTVNQRPVANAGADQTVDRGAVVQLDGSGSRDADGDALTYRWITLVGIALSSQTVARPTFVANSAGIFRLALVVNDGKMPSTPDTMVVTVRDVQLPPVTITATTPAGTTHEMVLVPEGEFPMGSSSGEGREGPVHTVYLNSYYIDRYEVTNAQWNTYARATGKTPREGSVTSPVLVLPWPEAVAYCQWAGLRLPTEAEWEKAARGTDGRSYPWGEGIDANKANYGKILDRVTAVGSYPEGVSPYGAYDMAGNVWEWVADWYSEDYYSVSPRDNPRGPESGAKRVIRGGGYFDDPLYVRSSYREAYEPLLSSVATAIGFRCARDGGGTGNTPPAANAGPDQTAEVGQTVQLDGSGSRDADDDTLTYRWTAPSGITLSSATVARPSFSPTVAGTYQLVLVVNDGTVDSMPDTVVVTMLPPVSPLPPSPADRRAIRGTVYYSTTPLAGVTVKLTPQDESVPIQTTVTSAAGTYEFRGLVAGTYNIEIYKTSEYGRVGRTMTVSESDFPVTWDMDLPKYFGLISPANGSIVDSRHPLLTWEALPEAVKYTVQLNVTSSWELAAWPKGLTTNSFRVITDLLPGTEYTWMVEAYDAQDHYVGYSQTSFTFITPQETETITVELPGGSTMEMVWIESGTFTMGSPETELGRDASEGPQHQVTISRGFYLDKCEITQGQWEAVMGTRPWSGQTPVVENPNHPAVYVTWYDMQEFVHRLNVAAGDSLYRLPMEAEWEYACRAGTTTRWSFGDDENLLRQYAWYDANAQYAAHEVGRKNPNPWGLHDMHGNASEWCQDWFRSYTSQAQVDPSGPSNGSYHGIRGGDFTAFAEGTRSADRGGGDPPFRHVTLGARLLRMAEPVAVNTPPEANAGPDQSVNVGTTVQLDGSGSRDVDGDTLIYRWTAPAGITLSSTTVARPTFTASVAGMYQFVLVVNNGQADSVPDTVVVTVVQPNRAPLANAGPDQTSVDVGTTVLLDGTGSFDPDGNALAYRWAAPPGLALSSTTDARTSFAAVTAGTYQVSLVVSDGLLESAPDTVEVRIAAPPLGLVVDLPGGATMEFVWIEPGTFTMGSPPTEPGRGPDESPQHQVTISRGFWLAKYEVTQGQWESVMGTRPWSGQSNVKDAPRYPAVYIAWEDVQEMLARLNEDAGTSLYRAPTEAEWEYACRAGTTTPWSFGDDLSQLGEYAWFGGNAFDVGLRYAQAVGAKRRNPWGLYDMHGNVWEWVQDWYSYYPEQGSPAVDPQGTPSGRSYVYRGGGFISTASETRSARRLADYPGYRVRHVGARLVRNP